MERIEDEASCFSCEYVIRLEHNAHKCKLDSKVNCDIVYCPKWRLADNVVITNLERRGW